MDVREFRKVVAKETKVVPKSQVLLFGGKMFADGCDLCDYKLENGYTIILQTRNPLDEIATLQSSQNDFDPFLIL